MLGANCSRTPTPSFRCRCTGGGNGCDASINRPCWRNHRARRAAGWWSHGALKRIKATPQQVGLGKSERAENVQGAFRVPAEGKAEVAGRKLVLVDDVLTSGATVGWLRAGAAAGRCRLCRCAGLRPGCGGGPRSHIKRSVNVLRFTWSDRRNLHDPLLPLLPRRQAAAVAQRGRVHRDRRQRRSERAK